MKLYSLDRWKNYKVVEHDVIKETKKMLIVSPCFNYTKRVYKDDIGKRIFKTPREAILARIDKQKYFVSQLKSQLEEENNELKEIEKWAQEILPQYTTVIGE